VGTVYGHVRASQESWTWWCDVAEMVSAGIKVVYSLPVGIVQASIEQFLSWGDWHKLDLYIGLRVQ